MKRYLPFIIVAVVALVTLGSAAVLYRANKAPVLKISKEQAAAGKEGEESAHIRGNPKAAVTLEEFGDFECPPCAKLAEPLKEIEREYGDRLKVMFHHFPLINHRHAREAAHAAEAAGLQGRFWEMHDLLYKEQPVWSKANDVRVLFSSYAGMLGLKLDRFAKDIESEQVKARVAAGETRAKSLGVTNTPTIFVNDTAVNPTSLSPAGIRTAINAALNPKQKGKPE